MILDWCSRIVNTKHVGILQLSPSTHPPSPTSETSGKC